MFLQKVALMFEGFATNFHFLRPLWLLATPLIPLLWILLRQGRAGISQWARSISPQLLDVLLDSSVSPGGRRMAGIVSIALLFGILALAGPTWSRIEQPVQQRQDPLVIVLDLSLSMLTQDIKPSRLVRARQKIADILRQRKEGLTGLVVYAGDAHVVAPLTDDTHTIENLLGSLHPGMMPVLGSHPELALQAALELMHNSAMNEGRILLVTDGIDDISDVTRQVESAFPLYILGVGTPEGGPIPLDSLDRPGQYLEDRQGTEIVTRLDRQRLEKVAQLSNGKFHVLTLSDADIDTLLNDSTDMEDLSEASKRSFDVWEDQGYWLLLLLLPLSLLAFRKGAVVLLALCILPPHPAEASLWDDLWLRPEQQAYRALIQGDPETADKLFQNDYLKGLAEYRAGDYDLSSKRLERAASANRSQVKAKDIAPDERFYNLGNAYAKAGNYPEAIAAYEKALEINPEHEDAEFNKALVEDLLKQQQSSSGNENQQQQQQQDSGDSEQRPQDQQQDSSKQQDEQQGKEQQSAEQDKQEQQNQQEKASGKAKQEEKQSDTTEEERQQALEQWLRRVPDDPGGLLRRKFRHETNQKLRSGEFRRPNEERIW